MQNQDEKKIAITTRTKDEGIEIAVADSGPGIDTDAMDRLFEPFFTTKESGGGLGLGLSISYGIMKEMNGEIRAQNGARGGAVFTLIMQRYPKK
jgi:C4-dicarboxylate-specific signal transduction histidine kinase